MFDDFELNPEHVPAIKLGLHITQFVFTFILWCIEIAVFRDKDSTVNGQAGWTFAVCFLSLPAWVYLIMAPRFPRTRKLAQPHAMACVDGLFAIIWLTAFSTQAAYNTGNKCGGACHLSKAIVGLAVIVFLLFCASTFISGYTVVYWQLHNRLPGYDGLKRKGGSGDVDPDKAAFSMAPHDEEAYAPVHMDDHENMRSDYSDPYGAPSHVSDPYAGSSVAGSQANVGYGGAAGTQENPFKQDNPFDSDNDDGFRRPGPSAGGRYAAPTAQDDYEDDHRPVNFPSGNYDRITR